MEKEKFEGVEPEIKKEIMEEGFGEEGAAVLIGKKEEMPQLLEKLEKEGRAENLGSYIKMHKEIALPKEEIDEKLKEKLQLGLRFVVGDLDEICLLFVDKDKNVARVKIMPKKIASFKNKRVALELEEELEDFGFLEPGKIEGIGLLEGSKILGEIDKETQSYQRKIEKQIREKKAEEFDF